MIKNFEPGFTFKKHQIHFITKLIFFRHGDNLTQEQLALRLKVSRQTLNAIERRRKSPSLYLAYKIADYFAVDVRELFKFE